MKSTFMGLETARRGIHAHQTAISTTGHNITNANTAGYSRQRVNMQASAALDVPSLTRSSIPGQLGTGVVFSDISRIRETFLDDQFRNESQSYGNWLIQTDTLEKIELLFNEPSDQGFRSVIDEFWNAWQDLSQNPDELTGRTVIKERTKALIDIFQHTDTKLTELSRDLTNSLNMKVAEANTYIEQLAQLNIEIRRIEGMSDQANDLRDQRDLIVDKLAQIVPVEVVERKDSMYDVAVKLENGERQLLVDGVQFTLIGEENDAVNPAHIDGGEVQGILHSRDEIVQGYHEHLNEMLRGLIVGEIEVHIPVGSVLAEDVTDTDGTVHPALTEIPGGVTVIVEGINGLHELGWTYREDGDGDAVPGPAFFTLTAGDFGANFSIQNLQLNPDIEADIGLIASSMKVEDVNGEWKVLHGNGGLALAMGQLRDTSFNFDADVLTGSGTFDDYYRAVLGELGVRTQEAQRRTENLTAILNAVDQRRQSVSGVSLDEEMSYLIQFQHAYNASARMMTTVDQMLDRIINQMGIVGR